MKTTSTHRDRQTTRRAFLTATGALTTAAAMAGIDPTVASARRHPHKYEELLPEEFYEEQNRASIVYLPIGAPEEHGLQNVLAVDPWTAYEVCLRAADHSGGIVYPIIPFAPAGHPSWSHEELRRRAADGAPPSCFVSRELCKSLYIELMETLADLGFKVCMACGGHWPAEVLLKEIDKELGGTIQGMKFWGCGGGRSSSGRMGRDVQAEAVSRRSRHDGRNLARDGHPPTLGGRFPGGSDRDQSDLSPTQEATARQDRGHQVRQRRTRKSSAEHRGRAARSESG